MYAKVPLHFWAPPRRWWLYRDLVQFGHNFGKILLTAHDLPMICLWFVCKLQGAPFKMRQKFCTCKFFSIRASRGRPAPARGSPGAGAARAAQVFPKITDLLKKLRFKSWVFVVFQGRLRRWWLYRDLIQFGHNFWKTLLAAHDLPMIPMICLWSPINLPGAPMKMRKKFCTCENFSVLQKFRKSAQNQWKMQFFNTFLLKKKRVFHWAKTPKMLSKMRKFPQF